MLIRESDFTKNKLINRQLFRDLIILKIAEEATGGALKKGFLKIVVYKFASFICVEEVAGSYP